MLKGIIACSEELNVWLDTSLRPLHLNKTFFIDTFRIYQSDFIPYFKIPRPLARPCMTKV